MHIIKSSIFDNIQMKARVLILRRSQNFQRYLTCCIQLRVDLCPGTWHLSDNLWLNTSRRQYLYWWEWYIAFIVDIFSMLSIKVTTIHIYDCSSFLRVLYTTICFKNSVISSSIVDTTGTTFLSSMFLKTDWFQTLVSNLRIAQFNATGNHFTKKITKRHV